ncbi:nitroreductase family protein [Desulfotomaculum sp. 1211_IL3151]|uniref:nitroreductase family protein n=1 Tax=Desulfotomaculum sp. 1211_IL3151 TaxID=3084055 RepID=UPI002FD8D436
MNVIECIKQRRSSRSFKDQPVPTEVLQELITLGTRAATGSGNQPWGFVVIRDQVELKKISDLSREHWLANLEHYPHMKQYQTMMSKENYNMFYNAPCLLIIYGDSRSHWYIYDASLAAGNIMLAAKNYGLGTCWIGNAENICDTEAFKAKYNVPKSYQVVCPLIIGYPKAEIPPAKRKPALIFHI